MEKLLEEISFTASDRPGHKIDIDGAYVRERVGTLAKHHFKGVGFWITLFTSLGAMSFFWWISRPDLRHPYRRIQRGEYWGTGQGGFGGNWGGFGGGTSGEGFK